jgi:peptidyl-prolyl cis-trans isomerase SurA
MYKHSIFYIIFLLISFIFQPYSQAILLDRVVAKVNEDIILWTELITAMKQQNINPNSSEIRVKEKEVLDDLIDKKLQIQEAHRLGFTIDDKDVERTIDNIRDKYNLSMSEFEESLQNEGLTYEDYKSELREKLLISKLINNEIHSKIIISDDDVRAYEQENLKKNEMASRVHIYQIFFLDPLDPIKRKSLSDRAKNIYQRILNGEDISVLARHFSEDATSQLGGDIGFVQQSDLIPEVAEVAFKLDEGQVSEPFWSSKGLHIIKVVEKERNTVTKGLNEDIEKELRQYLYDKNYNKWMRKLRKNAFIEINL